jgi:hypothetical protein
MMERKCIGVTSALVLIREYIIEGGTLISPGVFKGKLLTSSGLCFGLFAVAAAYDILPKIDGNESQ